MNFRHFMNQRFRWVAYGGNILSLGVTFFFVPALLFNAILLISLAGCAFSTSLRIITGGILIAKLIADFLLISKYTALYKCSYLLKYFIPLFIVHPMLSLFVAIKGNLFSFTWKDTRYSKGGAQ
ncbi:MAG: hypothetical protein GX640_06615 [Fibrobacter sp.]|nr:hypothetical protein [Fibrobacter sp.]